MGAPVHRNYDVYVINARDKVIWLNRLICHQRISPQFLKALEMAEAEKRGERGGEGRHQAVLFYTDDSMVASSDPHWL